MTAENQNFEILNYKKSKPSRLLFLNVKNEILGEKYDLSLVFTSAKLSQKLNNEWRGKDNPTNILSFPLSKNSGEIYICEDVAKKEYKNFELNYPEFLLFLFIHGLLHLKGLDHSDKMEKLEKKHFSKFRDFLS